MHIKCTRPPPSNSEGEESKCDHIKKLNMTTPDEIREKGGRNLIPSLWRKHCSVVCTASNQALEVRGTWEPDYVVSTWLKHSDQHGARVRGQSLPEENRE